MLSSDDEQDFDLYKLLQIDKSSTTEQIKKAYKKLALQLHPDKNADDPDAKKNFQNINKAYQILIDKEKRQIYDQTGCIDDSDNLNDFKTAYMYFRSIYKKIEKEDIDNFEKQYRHSKEEEQDLIDFYLKSKGDVTELLMNIPCSYNSDIVRFIEFYQEKINQKQLKKYIKFDKTKNKVSNLVDESSEFQLLQKEQEQQGVQQSLVEIIQNKKNNMGSLIDKLEKKYKVEKQGNLQNKEYIIDDEEFMKIQNNIIKKKKK